MDYLTLLTTGTGGASNKEAAQRLYESVSGKGFSVFSQSTSSVSKACKEITSIVGKDDYLTLENVIADPEGNRITPFVTMDVMLQTCSLKHPSVKDDNTSILFGVENAMAIPAEAIVETPALAKDIWDGTAESALQSQIRFGFNPVTELFKNCCTSHTIIHSVLRSALLTLYEKTKEWGSKHLEEQGQEMSLCAVLDVMSKVCAIVEEAKEATARLHVDTGKKKSTGCGRCKDQGCHSPSVHKEHQRQVRGHNRSHHTGHRTRLQLLRPPW